MSENKQQMLSKRIANSSNTIKNITKEGLVFYIEYEPITKYIYWYDFYKLTNENFKLLDELLQG